MDVALSEPRMSGSLCKTKFLARCMPLSGGAIILVICGSRHAMKHLHFRLKLEGKLNISSAMVLPFIACNYIEFILRLYVRLQFEVSKVNIFILISGVII